MRVWLKPASWTDRHRRGEPTCMRRSLPCSDAYALLSRRVQACRLLRFTARALAQAFTRTVQRKTCQHVFAMESIGETRSWSISQTLLSSLTGIPPQCPQVTNDTNVNVGGPPLPCALSRHHRGWSREGNLGAGQRRQRPLLPRSLRRGESALPGLCASVD